MWNAEPVLPSVPPNTLCNVCDAVKNNKTLRELDLSGGFDSNIGGSAGAKHVAEMLGVNASVTHLDVRGNGISGDGASHLSAAVLGSTKMEVFNEIPIKKMRADSLTELNLSDKNIGVVGGMVLAGLVPVMASITQVLAFC